MNYKQQSNQGCLVVNLLYLCGIEPTRRNEQKILNDGLFRLRENYTLGCLLAFLDTYENRSFKLYVDNKYYFGVLKEWTNHPRITILNKKNDQKLLDSLDPPFIVYVDNNITDGWTHLPHFLLVTAVSNQFYSVFDPWEGKVSKLSKKKVLNGIDSLKNHIKVCPLIVKV